MVEPSESMPSWPYLALFLGDVSQKVIQIDLRLYDNPTKFHPTEKCMYYHFFITIKVALSKKCERYFCYLYRVIKWNHIVTCFPVCDNFPEFKNSETKLFKYLDILFRYYKHHQIFYIKINREITTKYNFKIR